jgi:hypothetical protein
MTLKDENIEINEVLQNRNSFHLKWIY